MSPVLKMVVALAVLLSPVAVHAQTYRTYGSDAFFSVDWQAGERRGRPVVNGHVVNTYGIAAHYVRVLVESLDAAGQERAAPAYRVVVLSWDWKGGQSRLPAFHRGG